MTGVGRLGLGVLLQLRPKATAAMDHQRASELFSEYLDGELPTAQKNDLEQHLGVCIQCRTDLEGLRQAVGGLGKLKEGAPPAFLEQIQKQINARSKGRFFGKRWMLFGRIPFEWVSLAMIVAMLLYYLLVVLQSPTGVRPAP